MFALALLCMLLWRIATPSSEKEQRREQLRQAAAAALEKDPVERALKVLERQRFKEARRRAVELGASVRGFYHTSAWREHWREVITEQLHMVRTCGSRAG